MKYDTYCNDCYCVEAEEAVEKLVETLNDLMREGLMLDTGEAVEKLVETLNGLICEGLMRDTEEAVEKQVETINDLMREGLMRDIVSTIGMVNQSIRVLLALGGLTDQEVSELRRVESYFLMAQDAMKRVMNTLPAY